MHSLTNYQWECTHGTNSAWGDTAEKAFRKFMLLDWRFVKGAFESELQKEIGDRSPREFEVVVYLREIAHIPLKDLQESYVYFRAIKQEAQCAS